jgi:DNA-binding LacI/PurR family transcriptional regulator
MPHVPESPTEGRKTLTAQVRAMILQGIRSGEFAADQRIPSEQELCARCNVSRITVRAAVQSLAQEGILRRQPGSGTFVRKSGLRTGTIAFLRCQHGQHRHEISGDLIYSDIVEGIQTELEQNDTHLMFSYIREEGEESTKYLEGFLHKADGLIFGEMRSERFYREVMSKGVPFLLIDPEFEEYFADTVDCDNLTGSVRAVEHLISLGHRIIAFANGRSTTRHAVERLNGYRYALEKHGIPFRPSLVVGGVNWQSESGAEAAKNLLAQNPDVTAIFCANDTLAIGAIKGIQTANLRVPNDVSVVGFDDMSIAAYSSPEIGRAHV